MSVWKVPLLYRRTCTPMTSIDMESLLTIIYVLVDDWYKAEGYKLLVGLPMAIVQPENCTTLATSWLASLPSTAYRLSTTLCQPTWKNVRRLRPSWGGSVLVTSLLIKAFLVRIGKLRF